VRDRLLVACVAAFAAFALYRATLMAGVDFGDTGSMQTMVGSTLITPRDGYPLYFAVGGAFLRAMRADPAHVLNLASAVEGALACGVIVLVAAELSGSVLAALAAALLFAGSYTFWSQSIIAEVYALHILIVGLTLWLLLRWEQRPTFGRLVAFFAMYALGFGNHLSMILLLPGFTLFLLLTEPRGWRSLLAPRVVATAIALALLGALQYAWNLRTLWISTQPPDGLLDALQAFWFDVTKTDWRETMVLNVPSSMLRDHAAMYLFDLRQQFGWPGVVLAVVGAARLFSTSWRRGLLMLMLYAVNVAFAYSYNVGDAHVFYLPSHMILALLMAPGIVAIGEYAARVAPVCARASRAAAVAVAAAAIVYAGVRIVRDYPALDRSGDERPLQLLTALTTGLDDQHAVLLSDLNWQIENGLSYFAKEIRPAMVNAHMPDVLLYAPALVRDNAAIGRQIMLTARARAELTASYGPLLPVDADPRVHIDSMTEIVRRVPPGTRYALCVLRPSRDLALDRADLDSAVRLLGADASFAWPTGDYVVLAGVSGRQPSLAMGSMTPFHTALSLDGVGVEVRMESWLAADTIRRMGFGHVIAARRHTLIVERGVSFAAFGADGLAIRTAYASSIFAPQPRYLIRNLELGIRK
jgi:hypothetical protein